MKRTASSAWLEIEKTEEEKAREAEECEAASASSQFGRKREDDHLDDKKVRKNAGHKGSLDSAGMTDDPDDQAALGMTFDEDDRAMVGMRNLVRGTIYAVADPQVKWWERLRGNPKRAGEISQAAFLLKAETLGFDLALPWGDNQKFDFVVWRTDGKAVRVQVKGTGRLHRRGYEVQPVHSTRRGGKKRYTKKEIDVIAAHVQPVDAWYLIPIEKVGRAKSMRLYPGIERAKPRARKVGGSRKERCWEQWKDAWAVLGELW